MHLLIALALAYVAVVAIGVPTSEVKVGSLSAFPPGAVSPATAAGLRSGDVIVSVNHHPLTDPNQFTDIVGHSVGRPVTLGIERDGRAITKVVSPVDGTRIVVDGSPYRKTSDHSSGIIGIMQEPVYSPEGPLRGIGTSAIDVGRVTSATFAGLGHFFSPHGLSNFFTEVTNSKAGAASAANPQGSDRPMSLIGIGRATVQAQQQGFINVIEILIAINIGFAILNMLPMLPLDGGHVAIALYERVRTRRGQPFYRADVTKLLPVAYAFMAFLVLITFSAVFLDIAHPAQLFH
jgi:membrane-associated protease RseP (regulator of RpoE activity)